MEKSHYSQNSAKSNKHFTIPIQSILVALIVLFGLGIFFFFLFFSGVNSNTRASFSDMLTGEAHRPFVTRVLVPWLTRGIAVVMPESVHTWAETMPNSSGIMGMLLTEYVTPPGFALEAIISLGLQLISLLGFAFAFRRLFQTVFDVTPLISGLMTLVALLGLTPMLFFGYIYDLPNLFLTTLALYCIAAQRKIAYWVVFALAILNKESAVVLMVPAVLLFWDFPRPSLRKVILGTAAQVSLFAAIRAPLALLYRNNPGEGFEYHLLDHIEMFRDYPVLGIFSLLVTAGILLMVFRYWQKKPAAVVLGVLPGLLLLVLFVLGGIAFEVRIFYEVYAAGFLCSIFTLLARKSPLESQLPSMQDWLSSLPALFGRQTKPTAE
jgi:hypothetical protein